MNGDVQYTVSASAREVASLVAPLLERRLRELYGSEWLYAVNAQRAVAGFPPGRGLHDHRFCLAVFGYDEATDDWAEDRWRRLARELNALANKAVHDESLTDDEMNRALAIAELFRVEHNGGRENSSSFVASSTPKSGDFSSSDFISSIASGISKQRLEVAAACERWLKAAERLIAVTLNDDTRYGYAKALRATAGHAIDDSGNRRYAPELWERLVMFVDCEWQNSGRDPIALSFKARALVHLNRIDEAVALAKQVTDMDHTVLDAWRVLAWASTMALGDYESGAAAARQLLRNDPNDDWAKYMLAEAFSGMGRESEAQAVYDDTPN